MKSKFDLQPFTIIGPRSTLTLRAILRGVGSELMAAPCAALLGCSTDEAANDNTGRSGDRETSGGRSMPPTT